MADDIVEIQLGESERIGVSSYSVKLGIFEQPGSFAASLGNRGEFKALAKSFPPRSFYAVYINGRRVQVGFTDGFNKGSGTEITVHGREILAKLVDGEVSSEKTFKDTTYLALTKQALTEVGLPDVAVLGDNEAHKKAVTGHSLQVSLRHATEEEQEVIAQEGEKKIVRNTLRAKVDSKWWEFLVEQYRREGLFLWADVDGNVILSTPNADQVPLYRFYRMVGERKSNILDGDEFSVNTSDRHSECRVYGRTASGKHGVGKFYASFIDDEMVALLNPPADRANGGKIKQLKTIRDTAIRSDAQARNLARRTIADERRSAWKLTYPLKGHSIDSDGKKLLIAPDTVADVVDEENGIEAALYIASVEYKGDNEETTTVCQMMRPQDLFFRTEEDSTNAAARKLKQPPRLDTRVIVSGIGTIQSRLRTAPGLGRGPVLPNDPFAGTALETVGDRSLTSEEGAREDRARVLREITNKPEATGGIGGSFRVLAAGLIEGF
jgi:prophage tail gpP-like protein